MKTFVIPTSSAAHLAKSLRNKGFQVAFPQESKDKKRYFPDGEVYIKLSSQFLSRIKKTRTRIAVLHSGAPKPNEGLVELELILQILKDNKIRPEVFFSYFPYGMQDRVFEKGETNVAENLIEKLVNFYKAAQIYIIDPHFGGRKWIKKYPIKTISAVPLLIQRAQKEFGLAHRLVRQSFSVSGSLGEGGESILFLSPDVGGKRRTGISGLKKERINSFRVEILTSNLNCVLGQKSQTIIKGKVIGVVDDVIKTGGTLLKFAEISKKAGAKKILALATHGVIPSGVTQVKKAYSHLYLTNTIWQKNANVDVTDLIAETLS